MGNFYEQISKYYDYIFPTGMEQLDFIRQSAGQPPKRILDVACGSGGYTAALAKEGYRMTAVDLEEEMVDKAREKAGAYHVQADVFQSDMKQLVRTLEGMVQEKETIPEYDCIFCIGNSLVHLGTQEDIGEALVQMSGLLAENGVLILQIINFDRVLKYKVSELPTLKNDSIGLEFIRRYEHDPSRGFIHFRTVLTVRGKDGQEAYENSIPLLPLTSGEMAALLSKAGFGHIEFFGDFKFSAYDEKSFLLVVRASK